MRDSDSSSDNEDVYEMSDVDGGARRITRNARGGQRGALKQAQLPSSDDDSVDLGMLDEESADFFGSRKTRNQAAASKGSKRRSQEEEKKGRSLRSRSRAVNYKEKEDSYEHSQTSAEEEKVNRRGSKRVAR
jgi:hypothetical protein